VGVEYLAPLRAYVAKQHQLARVEKIDLRLYEIERDPSPRDLRAALANLQEDAKIDALWVLNDNRLLSPELVTSVWAPAIRDGLPVAVGVEGLVSTEVRFGSFAILPDHKGLGLQAANMIFDLRDNQWRISERRVEQPVSVKTVMNVRYARARLGFREAMLERIDLVVE
jgi:putative ABC transport system substrate-binding protein